MLKAHDLLELRQNYRLLSNSEKQNLWKAKYIAILESDKFATSTVQKEIIATFLDLLKRNPIGSGKTENANDYLNEHFSFIIQHFTDAQLYMLAECPYYQMDFDINSAGIYLSVLKKGSVKRLSGDQGFENEIPNCNCYWSLSCQMANGGTTVCLTNADNNCTKVKDCGFWGDSNCTGRCG